MKAAAALLAVLVLAAACGTNGSAAGAHGVINVVAGENFWGSIASQLGGAKVSVQSVVTDPNADPHEYESSASDARAVADADLVVLNGAGYDSWGQKLLSANPSGHRRVLTVASVLGKQAGDNPHFWYDPGYVKTIADRITAQYRAIDSADAVYFDAQRQAFQSSLQPYFDAINRITARFRGTPVGSTESIFVYMAAALGLDLISPPEFMKAVAEGTDPPVDSVAAFQDQVTGKQVKLLVYNVQTVTAVTTNIRTMAAARGIPVVGVSETMLPVNGTFQAWQLKQLVAIEQAL